VALSTTEHRSWELPLVGPGTTSNTHVIFPYVCCDAMDVIVGRLE